MPEIPRLPPSHIPDVARPPTAGTCADRDRPDDWSAASDVRGGGAGTNLTPGRRQRCSTVARAAAEGCTSDLSWDDRVTGSVEGPAGILWSGDRSQRHAGTVSWPADTYFRYVSYVCFFSHGKISLETPHFSVLHFQSLLAYYFSLHNKKKIQIVTEMWCRRSQHKVVLCFFRLRNWKLYDDETYDEILIQLSTLIN